MVQKLRQRFTITILELHFYYVLIHNRRLGTLSNQGITLKLSYTEHLVTTNVLRELLKHWLQRTLSYNEKLIIPIPAFFLIKQNQSLKIKVSEIKRTDVFVCFSG